MSLAASDCDNLESAQVYFESSLILSDILSQATAFEEGIQLLTTAIKNAENSHYWHLRLIFQLAVNFNFKSSCVNIKIYR